MSGTGAREYFMRAGVARRTARRLEEDTVSPQVGRKHVRCRDRGVLHAGWSIPEDCQEAGGEYRLPTGGQQIRLGTGTGEYFMRAGVSRRLEEEDTVSPQVGRKYVRFRNGEYFMQAAAAQRIARRLEERYRFPTGGQKTYQV